MKNKRTIHIGFQNGLIPVDVDALDLNDIPATMPLCMDEAANFRAGELCSKILGPRSYAAVVYVIAPEGIPVSKIGIANNPNKRLIEIQNGNWNKLSIAALLWAEEASYAIEQVALKAAKQMGIRLIGEWIAAEPHEACDLILKAARHTGKPVYDSATWLNNWSYRLDAVAKAKDRSAAFEKMIPQGRKSTAW